MCANEAILSVFQSVCFVLTGVGSLFALTQGLGVSMPSMHLPFRPWLCVSWVFRPPLEAMQNDTRMLTGTLN